MILRRARARASWANTLGVRSPAISFFRSPPVPRAATEEFRVIRLHTRYRRDQTGEPSVGMSAVTVRAWRERFAAEGLAKFGRVREGGRGRKPSISAEKVEAVVHANVAR